MWLNNSFGINYFISFGTSLLSPLEQMVRSELITSGKGSDRVGRASSELCSKTWGPEGTQSILGMDKIFSRSRRKRTGFPQRLEKDFLGWRVRRGTGWASERGSELWRLSADLEEALFGMLSGAKQPLTFLCARGPAAAAVSRTEVSRPRLITGILSVLYTEQSSWPLLVR